eukprot:763504-Hanusia_phi.AAC.4
MIELVMRRIQTALSQRKFRANMLMIITACFHYMTQSLHPHGHDRVTQCIKAPTVRWQGGRDNPIAISNLKDRIRSQSSDRRISVLGSCTTTVAQLAAGLASRHRPIRQWPGQAGHATCTAWQ